MDEANLNQEEKEGGGKTKTGILILIGIILVLVIFNIYLLAFRNHSTADPIPATTADGIRAVVVNEENVDEIVEQMASQEYVPPGYYTVRMTNEWYFPTGRDSSPNARVENAEENTNDVYFDLFLDETEQEVIYKSPVIPRGSSLDGIILDTPIDAGTHECLMVYHLVDEDQHTLSTLRVTVTLIVGE